MANVLVIGSGGREHALLWKLSQSPKVSRVFVSPGNAGTMKDNHSKCENACVNVKDFKETAKFCKENQVQLVVVGPEDPLAAGIVDVLQAEGISCFGPTAAAAKIEASKRFAKDFMTRHSIPTAEYKSFTNVEEACSFIDQSSIKQFVVKTSGLAAGKGVIVTETREEAKKAVIDILQNKKFGDAGQEIVIEEKLIGEEVSCLAFTDGETIAMMPPSQDHKTLMEGDTGPNTGGMGVIAPYPNISLQDKDFIKNCIVGKAVAGFKKEGVIYKGVLYAGLMLTRTGPKVLEFNCRFGDPETQAIMMLLQSDLYDVCLSCVQGTLQHHFPLFDYDSFVVGVVVVSGGYPEAYRKGLPVSGLDKVASHNRTIFHAGTAIKDSQLVTSGGRVLAVMATASSVKDACLVASEGAALVQFDGAFFRRDIGFKVFSSSQGLTYKDAGVDIEAGNKLVENIKPIAKATARAGCSADLGGFGALFDMKATGYQDPILVSGTDGVGTKLKVAQKTGIHNTIGIDLVAMCVNDILAQGAEPLFFLDYFSTGNLSVSIATEVITGIAEGCRQAGCALIGGETAEMPSLYQGSDYDLAGFAVGAVERDRVLPNLSFIQEGDILIGLKSSGVHSNGFSLVRKVMEKWHIQWDQPSPYSRDKTIGEDLLEPTKIYVQSLLPLIKEGKIKAFAHITGGGLLENIPRVLPEGLCAVIDSLLWSIPPVFGWIAFKGNVPTNEMCRTFNCGIGGVLVLDKALEGDLMSRLSGEASVIGQLHKVQDDSSPRVVVKNLKQSLQKSCPSAYQMVRKKRVGVLISGTGTNLQALIDHTNSKENESCAEIIVVISNKAGVAGLERAKNHNIPTKVIDHRQFKSREEFDAVIHQHLKDADVDIVCLAGFMRILSGWFVKQWKGRMLNIHPSLLPSFKGSNAQKQAVDANVRISGCTVHFVEEEVDAGAIIVQESVPVYPGDTVDTLTNRIKKVEHKAFPRALEIVASEQVVLNSEGLVEWKY